MAELLDLGEVLEVLLGVLLQPVRVVIDHGLQQQGRHIGVCRARQLRVLLPQPDELVDLLLVFGHDDLDAGEGEDVEQLFADRRGVDADDRSANALRGQLGNEPFGSVVTEDRDDVAALDAEGSQTVREIPHAGGIQAPTHGRPDAIALLLHRGRIGARLREVREQPREGVASHQWSSAPR